MTQQRKRKGLNPRVDQNLSREVTRTLREAILLRVREKTSMTLMIRFRTNWIRSISILRGKAPQSIPIKVKIKSMRQITISASSDTDQLQLK